jgi:hypothetical protein
MTFAATLTTMISGTMTHPPTATPRMRSLLTKTTAQGFASAFGACLHCLAACTYVAAIRALTCKISVGDTGIEPVTSSV